MTAWSVHRRRGSAADLHAWAIDEPAQRGLWVLEADAPALVLGSTQSIEDVDRAAAAAQGVGVVHRRSGGGAVLVLPGECTWLDVVLPAGDPLWVDDVSRSFAWLGRAWAHALADLDVSEVEVAAENRCLSGLARVVCFAGIVTGEVTQADQKLVGLSQRRSRAGARFQCVVHASWRADRYAELLAPGLASHGGTAAVDRVEVGTARIDAEDLVAALLARLP